MKVEKLRNRHPCLSQKGPQRDPQGDNNGDKKDPKAEKVTFRKHQYYCSKTILSEARGGQKAPQRAPKGDSENRRKNEARKRGQKGGPRRGLRPLGKHIWAPGSPRGGLARAVITIKQQPKTCARGSDTPLARWAGEFSPPGLPFSHLRPLKTLSF